MIETTIKKIFGEKNLKGYVYLVLDNKSKPVYVGKAEKQCVSKRISLHIGSVFGNAEGSKFSKHLYKYHPRYFSWKIKIYTAMEIAAVTNNKSLCLSCAERALYDQLKGNGMAPSCNAQVPHRCAQRKSIGSCI